MKRRDFLGAATASTLAVLMNSTMTQQANAINASRVFGGVDISWLTESETAGARFFTSNGVRIPPLKMLKKSGVSICRLRVFVDPSHVHGSLASTLELARRIRRNGLDVMLDFHLSDSWADPGQQRIPASWNAESVETLGAHITEHITNVLNSLRSEGVTPSWIQVGNEISNGILWPVGQLQGEDTAAWQRYVSLLNAGISAVRTANPESKILLHTDSGGDAEKTSWWLRQLDAFGIQKFDAVGVSFYPQWHGDLKDLERTLGTITRIFARRVMVVETAYPWTSELRGGEVLNPYAMQLPRFSLNPQGQADFVRAVKRLVANQPNKRGLGVVWWEGLALDAGETRFGMRNSALARPSGRALPALKALGS